MREREKKARASVLENVSDVARCGVNLAVDHHIRVLG